MEDQVTPTLEKTPEAIDLEMAQTREAISEKVAAIEAQVVGTVSTAADTLTETVATMKTMVNQAPAAVTDTVKQVAEVVRETMSDVFDISSRVRRNPWASLGIAAMAGCTLGWLTGGRRTMVSQPVAPVPFVPPAGAPATSREPGMLDELWSLMGDSMKDVARTALASFSTALKDAVQREVPNLVADRVAAFTEDPSIVRLPTSSSGLKSNRIHAI